MTDMQLKYLAHQENVRHNLVSEGQGQQSVNISASRVAEEKRDNIARLELDTAKHQETARSNLANEQIARDRNEETQRHNEQVELDMAFDTLNDYINTLKGVITTFTPVTMPRLQTGG